MHLRALAFILATITVVAVARAQDGLKQGPAPQTPASQPAAKVSDGQSSFNIQRLLTATLDYSKKNQGRVPTSLEDLSPFLAPNDGTLASLLKNPQRPELGANGYIYISAQEQKIDRIIRPNNRVAIYEAGDFRDGVHVGFWDGHVEWVVKRSEFNALLAAVLPRSRNPRQMDPKRPETFGHVDQKASVEAQSFQIVRELTEAVVMYTNDNRLHAPTDLKHLGHYLLQPNDVTPTSYITNPRCPQYKDQGYEYILPKSGRLRVDFEQPPDKQGLDELPVIYEAGNINDGIFIGFWDGHAEYVRKKAEIEKLLAAAKAR